MPLGQIAGGAFQLSGGADPELPRRDLSQEARAYGGSLRYVLPYLNFYAPQLQALQQQQQQRTLFGTQAGTTTTPQYGLRYVGRTEGHYDLGTGRWIPPTPAHYETTQKSLDVYTPESPGLLNLIRDVQPGLRSAREAGDTEGYGLLDLLTRDAEGLVRGGGSPLEDRELQQSIRGAQSARGLAYSPGSALEEIVGLDRGRDARRIQRGQYGSGILALRRGYQGDPASDALRLLGFGDLTAAQQFTNPFNSYNADLQNTNYGARAYEEIAARNNRVQGIQNVGSGVTSLAMLGFGGGFGGMGGMMGGGMMGGGMGGGAAGGVNSNSVDFLRRGQYF